MGVRAGYVVARQDATSSFEIKMRIEKVGGNRKGALDSNRNYPALDKIV